MALHLNPITHADYEENYGMVMSIDHGVTDSCMGVHGAGHVEINCADQDNHITHAVEGGSPFEVSASAMGRCHNPSGRCAR